MKGSETVSKLKRRIFSTGSRSESRSHVFSTTVFLRKIFLIRLTQTNLSKPWIWITLINKDTSNRMRLRGLLGPFRQRNRMPTNYNQSKWIFVCLAFYFLFFTQWYPPGLVRSSAILRLFIFRPRKFIWEWGSKIIICVFFWNSAKSTRSPSTSVGCNFSYIGSVGSASAYHGKDTRFESRLWEGGK